MQKNIVNKDLALITLPMKPHREEKIGMIVIPSVADILARRLGAKSYLGVNLLDSYVNRADFINVYYKLLCDMGINFDGIWVDSESKESLLENIKKIIDNGFVKEKTENVLRCPCGVIDMKSGTQNDFVTKRSYVMKDEKPFCSECGEECKVERSKVLVFDTSGLECKSKMVPDRMFKQKVNFHKNLKENGIIVSRARDTKIPTTVNESKYNIDVDFALLTYLACIPENKRIVIGSNHHVYQMYIMDMIEQALGEDKETAYITMPYVKMQKGNEFDLKKELFNMDNNLRETYIFTNAFRIRNTVNYWSMDLLKYFKKIDSTQFEKFYERLTTPIKMEENQTVQSHILSTIKQTDIQKLLHNKRGKNGEER